MECQGRAAAGPVSVLQKSWLEKLLAQMLQMMDMAAAVVICIVQYHFCKLKIGGEAGLLCDMQQPASDMTQLQPRCNSASKPARAACR